MYKLLQILRASRLILLIILLLITIISQLSRAETAQMFSNGVGNELYGSCQAACAAVESPFYKALPKPIGNIVGMCYGSPEGLKNDWNSGVCITVYKTCDAKELTHNGVSDGVPSQANWHWMRAPEGIDAKDWYSDRFNTCENNCIVLNIREFFDPGDGVSDDGRSVTESDGLSRSMFTKRQTGTVCVNEKKKPDEPIKPPPPADDGKPDSNQPDNGQSGSGAGTDNGQGQSGNNQSGSGGESESGNGSQSSNSNPPDQNSGNDGSGGSSSGGSGGGSGGSQGGGLQIGPGGGGTSGGKNGGNADNGSEGGTGGEGSDNGDGKSDGGNGSGEGSDQSGGDGAITGDKDGDGEGEGDGKGEGSISGGSCAAEQAPSCKGDPVQCYIAVEQWRTACATAGNKSEIISGNCKTGQPPECKGDATQCYIAKQNFDQACAAAAAQERYQSLHDYGKSQQGYLDQLAKDGNPDSILSDVKTEKIDLTGKLRTDLVRLGDSCPTLSSLDLGMFGKHEIPTDQLCNALRTFGRILLALSYVFAFGIVVRAF